MKRLHGLAIAEEARLAALELAGCDFSFDVAEEAIAPFDGSDIVNVVPVTPYRKTYEGGGDLEPEDDSALFAARNEGRLCGYVVVSRAWNNYCQIEDIAVDRPARRHGAGALLLGAAVAWARSQGLPGMRLETQSNNVPACRFYARHGFTLGGHDRHLYSALPGMREETALYWYRFFGADPRRETMPGSR